MKTEREHDVVRVIWLDGERSFTGTPGVARRPEVGDVGAIVHVYSERTFMVECVDSDGMTVWIADFHLGELENVRTVGTLFPDFLSELETMVRAVGRDDLVDQLQGLPVLSRCTCGDSNCAHFYTSSKPASHGGQHENVLLPSRSGLVVLDVLHGRVMAIEILDRLDVKRVLDAHLPAHGR
jgi:hypothetical protein